MEGRDDEDMGIEELERIIASFPKGVVTEKTINGKVRYYHQWYEDGRQHTKYVRAEDYPALRDSIEKRRRFQVRLKEVRSQCSPKLPLKTGAIVGRNLRFLCEEAAELKRRDCFPLLERYLSRRSGKVCILYGLRRTGKTTMMLQAISDLSDEELEKTAYIFIRKGDRASDLYRDLMRLFEDGVRRAFIDGATWLDDFIGSASMFLMMAAMGMSVVLSGADSLGFWFANDDTVYGKAVMIHTTYIPFGEHSRLLGIDDIDDYIRYGGVLRQGEYDLEYPPDTVDDLPFYNESTASRYIDAAIANNIQNALRHYNWGGNLRNLTGLYEEGLLTGAINRVVHDTNHRFIPSVLNDAFESSTLSEVYRNVTFDKDPGTRDDALTNVDIPSVLSRLENALGIVSGRRLEPYEIGEMMEYLKVLDLFTEMPAKSSESGRDLSGYTLCLQPGMRFCQAQELVKSLDADPEFSSLDADRRASIMERVEATLLGHVMEEIVLYETMRSAKGRMEVFKLFLISGDVDMVAWDRERSVCALFEVKHSGTVVPAQTRRLFDEATCAYVERTFGRITGRYVVYRGDDAVGRNGAEYLNVEKYLKGLPGSALSLLDGPGSPPA